MTIPTREELAAIRERATPPRFASVVQLMDDRDALLALVDALTKAAVSISCDFCQGSGRYLIGHHDRPDTVGPCPDCGSLRELLEVVK